MPLLACPRLGFLGAGLRLPGSTPNLVRGLGWASVPQIVTRECFP